MDQYLIDYLFSGKAWLLIGSGLSVAMGYPTWARLAEEVIRAIRSEIPARCTPGIESIQSAFTRAEYPTVFDEAVQLFGWPRVLLVLRDILRPAGSDVIYELIAKWPVRVYMTTNYDDEISTHLARIGEPYTTLSNSEDHMGLLSLDSNSTVVKLHGDLTSSRGLILTKRNYDEIQNGESWQYWRTKLTSIFQILPVVIIGHSLADKNIKHVLEVAKRGAGVTQPVCWIAPDVEYEQRREYLEKYRIRVVTYSTQSGDHSNLVRLIRHITDFMPPRLSIHQRAQIAAISESPLGKSAAAPGFFVYNRLTKEAAFEERRLDILISVIESALPKLKTMNRFTLREALKIAGWPPAVDLGGDLERAVGDRAQQSGILELLEFPVFTVAHSADSAIGQNQQSFDHLRDRFVQALSLRLKKNYPMLHASDVGQISSDIESSLIGYFREGGLSLATTLFCGPTSGQRQSPVPSSIMRFIAEASTRYDSGIKRQAFCTVSVDAFVRAESPEREYLGRISQGFFAFHALGVLGDVAHERLSHAKDTVWLIDSNVLIGLLAVASSSSGVFRDSFGRLRNLGIRCFTTDKLFDEVHRHYYFANKLIQTVGPASPSVLASALGDVPYSQSNAFLEGFINWQAAGNRCDWGLYLFEVFGKRSPDSSDMKSRLTELGIEVVGFQDWPGFAQNDLAESLNYASRIVNRLTELTRDHDTYDYRDPHKKAGPEAEALMIIKSERSGKYHMLSELGQASAAWFVSDTSLLNVIDSGVIITWQSVAFVRFVFTLAPKIDRDSAERAFASVLMSIARSGVSLLSDNVVSMVFGGVIDQERLSILEQRQEYEETLASIYGEPLDKVLERIPLRFRHVAGVQLTQELAQAEIARRKLAESNSLEARRELKSLKEELNQLKKYRKKVGARKAQSKKRARRNASKQKLARRKRRKK